MLKHVLGKRIYLIRTPHIQAISMLAIKVVLLLQLLCVQAQLPILTKPAGFRMNNCSLSARIQLEAFIDPLCRSSKFSHPILKNLSTHYKPDEVCIRIVPFPLIFHVHTYEVTTALYQVVNALEDSVFVEWLEAIYEVQDVFLYTNGPNFTRLQVREKVHEVANKTFPNLANSPWTEESARLHAKDQLILDWRYSCSQGAYGTGLFTLNGVLLEAEKGYWEFEDWHPFLHGLLHPVSN
nr:conserved hypothetical protein [Albugo laibachii Nc14]|eukprot:CCA22794.1 conserved hypothetical protein [Albugo laibachii Nc14]